jgi:hypothetical protein
MSDTNRKYNVNEEFFDEWSKKMAWVLGLFYADASIGDAGPKCRKSKRVSLMLKDEETVVKVKKALESEHPIKLVKGKYYLLNIGSKKLFESLSNLGMKNRVMPPVPIEYASDFMRGFIDGDGCSYRYNHGKYSYVRTVLNNQNEELLENMRELIEKCGFKTQNVYYDKWSNVSRVVIHGTKFIFWLYDKKETWFMKRKYLNCLDIGGLSFE